MNKYIYILLVCYMSIAFVSLCGCGDRIKPTSTHETTPTEHTEPATPEPTKNILTVDKAKDLISGIFEYYEITYIPEMNKQDDGVLHYAFLVDYTRGVAETSPYTYCYAWVNSVAGYVKFEEAGYTETNGRNLYANMPDSMFPIPMRNGTAIPYDQFTPPDYVRSVAYSYTDKSIMETYQAQLREAGFVDHGQVMSVDSLWVYKRDEDGATLMVEFYNFEDREGFDMCMFVGY